MDTSYPKILFSFWIPYVWCIWTLACANSIPSVHYASRPSTTSRSAHIQCGSAVSSVFLHGSQTDGTGTHSRKGTLVIHISHQSLPIWRTLWNETTGCLVLGEWFLRRSVLKLTIFSRRICPGMWVAEREVWLAISRMLWAFKMEEIPGEPIDLKEYDGLSGRSPVPFRVKMVPRHANVEKVLGVAWNTYQKSLF